MVGLVASASDGLPLQDTTVLPSCSKRCNQQENKQTVEKIIKPWLELLAAARDALSIRSALAGPEDGPHATRSRFSGGLVPVDA
eukprot:4204757-Amphidinium_carterae.1